MRGALPLLEGHLRHSPGAAMPRWQPPAVVGSSRHRPVRGPLAPPPPGHRRPYSADGSHPVQPSPEGGGGGRPELQ
eukprot:9348031-Alexandrium_andersonii.AAC.1